MLKVILNPSLADANEMDNIHFPGGAAITGKQLAEFSGFYAVNPSINFEIRAEADLLRLEEPVANLDAVLFPDDDNKFATISGDFKLEFGRDDNGKVSGLMASVMGQMIPAKKIQ